MDVQQSAQTRLNKINAFIFHGKSGEYFSIWLVNLLLTIITLGIYSAWATVRNKRYFYGNLELDGDRFDYHARPMQILLGRLLVIGAIIIFYLAMFLMPAFGAVIAIVFAALIPWIIIRSWRYHAIMSSYRGVRFNYHCRIGRAYWVMFGFPVVAVLGVVVLFSGLNFAVHSSGSIAAALIVGLLMIIALAAGSVVLSGIFAAMRYDLYVNNLYFGNQKFTAALSKKKFIKMAFISVLIILPFVLLSSGMMVVSLGTALASPDAYAALLVGNVFMIIMVYLIMLAGFFIAACYLFVAHRNYLFSRTSLCDGQLVLRSSLTTGEYLGLLITNSLLVIFTLGLASPVAHIRHARYLAENTHIEGDTSLAMVNAHGDTAGVAVAEEMVQALDLNIGL
ncbi:YjgN family protein [Entomohabitans teleogrylli]|uniref:YjgN family protein n=1 Tax=Entomohabitans teleogrylli TaxID=1384589 RepID=UPI00073D8C11|nr:YjgN family protein [Entomohabitans teleogrylli]